MLVGCYWPFASIYEIVSLAAMGLLGVIRFETWSCLRCAQSGLWSLRLNAAKCDLSRGVSGVRGRPEGNLSLVSPILSRTFLLGKVSELCFHYYTV